MADATNRAIKKIGREVELTFTFMLTSAAKEIRLEFDEANVDLSAFNQEVGRRLGNNILREAIAIEPEPLGQRFGVILTKP